MAYIAPFIGVWFLVSSVVYSAPAPRPQKLDYATFASDAAAFPTGTPTAIPFPGATGSLRGGIELNGYSASKPKDTDSTVIPQSDFELTPGQEQPADDDLYLDFTGVKNFQPIRGGTKAPTDPGPRTPAYERLNPDLYVPPTTDSGSVPYAKWPLDLSHARHGTPQTAGWARQENDQVLSVATGVCLRQSTLLRMSEANINIDGRCRHATVAQRLSRATLVSRICPFEASLGHRGRADVGSDFKTH